MLEVKSVDQRGSERAAVLPPKLAEKTTKMSLAPLRKHSLGGCTIDGTLSSRTAVGGGNILFTRAKLYYVPAPR